MAQAAKPIWLISYEDKNVSLDIANMVTDITYTDYLQGKSDELELTVEDAGGLWRSGWYPSQGDRFDVKIGYPNQPMLGCGRFEVDEIQLQGPPDALRIRGLAAGNSSPLRTARWNAFEGLSIDGIVGKVASGYGYKVIGDFKTGTLKRVTQQNESDLAFLKRLAEENGFIFSLRGDSLVFMPLLDIEKAKPILTLDRTQLDGYDFSDKAQATYVACEWTFDDPETGKHVTVRVEAENVRPRGGASNLTPGLPSTIISQDRNSRGDQVRDWQRFLQGQGLYSASIDGIFGPITDRGTRAFQRARKIQVDGDVGPETYGQASQLGFVSSSGDAGSGGSGDVLRKTGRCESVADAETKAAAALRQANRLKVKGTISIPGNQNVVAGAKITLTNMLRMSGLYTVDKSVHHMTRSGGYDTRADVAYV
jgi:phage protein D